MQWARQVNLNIPQQANLKKKPNITFSVKLQIEVPECQSKLSSPSSPYNNKSKSPARNNHPWLKPERDVGAQDWAGSGPPLIKQIAAKFSL